MQLIKLSPFVFLLLLPFGSTGWTAVAIAQPAPNVRDQIEQQQDDSASTAAQLLQQGFQQLYTSQLQAAIATFQQVVEQAQQNDDRVSEAAALLGQSEAYLWLGRFKEELAAAQQALEIYRDLQDRAGEAAALHQIGDAQLNLQKFEDGLATLQQALLLRREVNDRQGEAWTLGLIGIGQVKKGDVQPGLATMQESLAILQESVESDLQLQQSYRRGVILAWIGEAYRQRNEYEKANEFIQQAMTLGKTTPNQAVETLAQIFSGATASDQKQFEAALTAYQQAQTLATQIGDQLSQGWILYRIGNVYSQQEQHGRAIETYQQALSLFQTVGNQTAQAEAFFAMANVYKQQDQHEQAIEIYQQALALFRSIDNRPGNRTGNRTGELNTINAIAYTYIDTRQYEQARSWFQQQLEIAQQANDRSQMISALQGRGDVDLMQAQLLYADGAYAESVAAAQQSIEPFRQAIALVEAAEISSNSLQDLILRLYYAYVAQGLSFYPQQQYAEATTAIQQALDVLEAYRSQISEATYFEQRISALRQLGNVYSNNGQYVEALAMHQAVAELAIQLNDPAVRLQAMGFIFYNQSNLGNYNEALATAQQMGAIAREQLPDDAEAEMEALIKLGQAYGNLNQYPAALEQYQQALSLARELSDISSETSMLNNIALVYTAQGQYLRALEVHQQVLALEQTGIEQLQTNSSESFARYCPSFSIESAALRQQCLAAYQYRLAVSLNNLVSAYQTLGRYPEALAAYQQGLQIALQSKSLDLEASLRSNVGSVYAEMGKYAEALAVFERTLDISVTTGSRPTQSLALNNIGRVYSEQGQYPRALEYFQRSLEIVQATGDLGLAATLHNNIGYAYDAQGKTTEALTQYQQSLAIRQRIGTDFSIDLNNIASLDASQGRYAEALTKLQQALTFAQTSGKRLTEAIVLGNTADVYTYQAEYARAIELKQQALAIYQEIGARASEIVGLTGLGRSYHELGQYDQALALHQQALNLSREIEQRPGEALALSNIGRAYLRQEQFAQALSFYQQGLQIVRDIGDVGSEAVLLDAIGRTYERQGDYERAIETYQQALQIARSIGNLMAEAATLHGLGLSYAAQQRKPEALAAFQQALAIQRQIGAPAEVAQTLASLGKFLADQNQIDLAIAFYKQSVNLTESIRRNLGGLPQEQQESYTATIADSYRQLADLLLQQDRVLEAQQVLDLLKVQELEDYLQDVRLQDVRGSETTAEGIANRPAEAAIQQSVNDLSDRAIAIGKELSQLAAIPVEQRSPEQQAQVENLRRQQEALMQEFIAFIDSPITQNSIAQRRQTTDGEGLNLASLRDLQSNLAQLQQNAALLYPFVLDNRLELILVTPDAPPIRRTVTLDKATLNRTIVQFRQALEDPSSDAITPAQQLYQWLIQPLEADLAEANIQTLIYAPDGQLRYIPLAALHDGNHWLAQRLRINHITAASLDDINALPSQTPRVFAGAFSEGSYTVPVGNRSETYHGLPFAEREVNLLAALMPGTKSLFNRAFNLSSTAIMNDYSIVHLATHAAFVPGTAEDSFILFGDGNMATLNQIRAWDLTNVDLVVLSACETGLGEELGDGREILGLGYRVQQTGAKAVIASLWSVNDGGTQILMDAFYTALNNGYSKAEALQRAQQALITGDFAVVGSPRGDARGDGTIVTVSRDEFAAPVNSRLDHPYYWAPFILIGNGL